MSMETIGIRLSRLRERLRKIQVPIDPNRGKDLESLMDKQIAENGDGWLENNIGMLEAQAEIAETF